ncbi:CGNR zinc finger domain-containing protein [Actinomadura rudentiformis]|uniref:CGNR zinc finger domain-containing protein n=1 Tax=Actinomadura rudentiformis TaxID=359158 RepID=A0A6H9ZA12_9ACTN|nr:CGNR zinc finger domain-containing protein [Actinomadura rudentiformis]KAB2352283.1 CGNR zinc finger domain-containing protein [Actinomadura rudentiformis]
MEIACNVTRQAPLIAHLVNLATAQWRGGARTDPLDGDALTSAFAESLSQRHSAALRATPDAGRSLAALAGELREALLAGSPAARAQHINALIRRYSAQPYLVEDVDQPFHLHFHGQGGTEVDALGGEFAAALALIVDGYGPERFGECQAHQCEAVYIDLTRNGSRRYCSASCTARAKTAAYRSRQQGGAAATHGDGATS